MQTLNGALQKGLGEKAKKLLGKLGKNLLQAGPVVGPAINVASGGALGLLASLVSGSLDFSKRFLRDADSVESVFNALSKLLADQPKRFLVIIDDIDRLTPEESLLVFRLLKSVGRLPNVIYLVVFDRKLAEDAVAQQYPSEGPHFLEKIIQANFELPLPARDDLNNAFLREFEARCGAPTESDEIRHLMNLFYDVVAPNLNSPRDLARLTNSIAVSWPPVANEVNRGDFVALEAIRVFDGSLYNAIRANKLSVCGREPEHRGRSDSREDTIKVLLRSVPDNRKDDAKTALLRLFPRLENVGYAAGFVDLWEASRRICSERHFDTYFRMSVGDEALSANELNELIARADDIKFVKQTFVGAVKTIRKNNKSKVPLLLDELNVHAAKIEKGKFEPLISAVFEVADDIDRDADQEGAFSIGDNQLRIHWLIRKLTYERCSLDERTKIFKSACQNAQVGWLVDFYRSAKSDHSPREGQQPEPPEKCLVTKEFVPELRGLTLKAIEGAAKAGHLIAHSRLAFILFRWPELAEDDGLAVRKWTHSQMDDDIGVANLARTFTRVSWSQGLGMVGLGDRVAIRKTSATLEGLEKILDSTRFNLRLNNVVSEDKLEEPYKGYVTTFLDALARKNRGEDD